MYKMRNDLTVLRLVLENILSNHLLSHALKDIYDIDHISLIAYEFIINGCPLFWVSFKKIGNMR
jgi:hypothetical protein